MLKVGTSGPAGGYPMVLGSDFGLCDKFDVCESEVTRFFAVS